MIVYLAGPMRGIHQFNFPAFDQAQQAIQRRYGWTVMSPAQMDRDLGFDETTAPDLALDGFDMEDAVRRDVDAVTKSDAIILLPGWERSMGCQFEIAVARFLDRGVWFWINGEVWEGSPVGPDYVRVVPTPQDAAANV